jgi:hypothetical protein
MFAFVLCHGCLSYESVIAMWADAMEVAHPARSNGPVSCVALCASAVDVRIKELETFSDDDVCVEVADMRRKELGTGLDVMAPCTSAVVMFLTEVNASVVGAGLPWTISNKTAGDRRVRTLKQCTLEKFFLR